FHGDVRSGIARTDQNDATRSELVEIAIVLRMKLNDLLREARSKARHAATLILRHRDDDMICFELARRRGDDVTITALEQALDAHTTAHRQTKARGVGFEIGSHLVPRRKRVPGCWKPHPVEAIVFRGRKESQRVPALAPRVADSLVGFQDHETRARLREMV